jgi:hypothetical protein
VRSYVISLIDAFPVLPEDGFAELVRNRAGLAGMACCAVKGVDIMAPRIAKLDDVELEALPLVLVLVASPAPERPPLPEPGLEAARAPDQEGEPSWEDAAWQ